MKPWQQDLDRARVVGDTREYLASGDRADDALFNRQMGGNQSLEPTLAMLDLMPMGAAAGVIVNSAGKRLGKKALDSFAQAVKHGDKKRVAQATKMFPELNDYEGLLKQYSKYDNYLPEGDMSIAKNIWIIFLAWRKI